MIRLSSAEKDGLSAAHGITSNVLSTVWEHAHIHINILILQFMEYQKIPGRGNKWQICVGVCTPCPRYEWWGGRSQALTFVLICLRHCNIQTHTHSSKAPPTSSEPCGHHGNLVRVGVGVGGDDSLQWVREFSLGQKKRQCEKKNERVRVSIEWGEGVKRGQMHPRHKPQVNVEALCNWRGKREQLSPPSDLWSLLFVTPCPHLFHHVGNNSQSCAHTEPA